jgi:hypothetical protein
VAGNSSKQVKLGVESKTELSAVVSSDQIKGKKKRTVKGGMTMTSLMKIGGGFGLTPAVSD